MFELSLWVFVIESTITAAWTDPVRTNAANFANVEYFFQTYAPTPRGCLSKKISWLPAL